MNKKNKVKFGLKNCHYAKQNVDEAGTITFADPVPVPGAVSLALDVEGDSSPFYADDGVYFTVVDNNGYSGDWEMALVPESFLTDILKEVEDQNGVLIENKDNQPEPFALLFEFTGDQRKIRHVLYNCTATRPSVEGETRESSTNVKTEKLSISAVPLPNGVVKAKTGTKTTDAVYNNWYKKVYEPKLEAASSSGTVEAGAPETSAKAASTSK